MTIKQIIGIIALILVIPSLISFITFSFHFDIGDPQKNVEQVGQLLADSVTPWWIGLVQTLCGWGIFGAILLIIFFLFLGKYPELS